MENSTTSIDNSLIHAIRNKKWIKIIYPTEGSEVSIKPIIFGQSSYDDYFVFAWGWHSGKPGYYRFDVDKIREVSAEFDFEDSVEEEMSSYYPKPTWVENPIAWRDDYPGWGPVSLG